MSRIKAPQGAEPTLPGGLRKEEHSCWGQKASCFCLNTHLYTWGALDYSVRKAEQRTRYHPASLLAF